MLRLTRTAAAPIIVVALLTMLAASHGGAALELSDTLPSGWEIDPTARPTVQTTTGLVTGARVVHTSSGASAHVFLSIPFAAPPVGDLRWAPPIPPTHAPSTPIDGSSQLPPACPQFNPLAPPSTQSEDCLYLNVWAPEAAADAPVAEWIYGGSFTSGSTAMPFYNGLDLTRQGLVVVTLNYRLGPFGFLATQSAMDATSSGTVGNYGLLDQSLAMQWTHANIHGFGGNAANITLMGESAGAISVCYHLTLAQDKGLFARAIMESPDCASVTLLAKALDQGNKFAAAVGCDSVPSGPGRLACMRSLSTEAVLNALPLAPLGSTNGASYGPVLDGALVKAPPSFVLEHDVDPAIPVILGTNKDSCTLFVMRDPAERNLTATQLRQVVAGLWDTRFTDAILSHYPLSNYELVPAASAWADMLSDYVFRCPTRDAANSLAAGGADTFLYVFDYTPSCDIYPPDLHKYMGSYHFAEVPYVFGNTVADPKYPCSWSANGTAISRLLQTAWSHFIHSSDPTPAAASWPLYSPDTEPAYWITPDPSVTHNYRADVCEFWKSVPPPTVVLSSLLA